MLSGKDEDQIKEYLTLFSECKHAEFLKPVLPGQTVEIKSELMLWKRGKLETKSIMYVNEQEVANMIISGYMVKK
jgi:3-hydroxymyristoyl/3-hydroxydecanoyl-(acyl carrier protein) dehydratase